MNQDVDLVMAVDDESRIRRSMIGGFFLAQTFEWLSSTFKYHVRVNVD